jgi:hypothetical protein
MADKEEKSREQIRQEMDAAAEVAAKELKKLPKDAVKAVATWMKAHKQAAGWKRLGKAIVATLPSAKKEADTKED